MSQHRTEKVTEAKEKTAFFTARTPQHKAADPQTQDGASQKCDMERDETASRQEDCPLTQSLLQTMLDAAVTKMQTAVTTALNDIRKGLKEIEARTSDLEDSMESLTGACNEADTRLSILEEQIHRQETKMADAEDRSRRNNIRLRGVPEDIALQNLTAYAVELFHALLPDIPAEMFLLDCIHRLPKPQHLPLTTPRDVFMRLHYYHIKEQILRAHRTKKDLPTQFKDILLFMDLSAETLRRRRSFKAVADTLRQNRVPYRWGYPAKLLITKGGKIIPAATPTEGLNLLKQWVLSHNTQPNPRIPGKQLSDDCRPQ
ncbi:Hypothetical predicted protein [Pelobates cultripes]|uniref:Uncharacterized protein n=1 Tax=Pelobates cultripes TaxID=61616 RepID=A0AAD1VVQ7_PELCU|nr:Hypothetical predicted protein [Pelobates cultripes]